MGPTADQETKIDCDNNDIEYIGFNIDVFESNNKYEIDFNKAFITNQFPMHNSASVLAFKNTSKEDELTYLQLKVIIDEKIGSSNVLRDYNENIEALFKNKYDDSKFSEDQFQYFEIKYDIFNKNKKILDYLTDFSFIIIIENKRLNIFIHFNRTSYNCTKNYEKTVFKQAKKATYQILFCFSSVPLALKNRKK